MLFIRLCLIVGVGRGCQINVLDGKLSRFLKMSGEGSFLGHFPIINEL